MVGPHVFLAHTHHGWFDNLSRLATRGPAGVARLDEVNFWSPKSARPIKSFVPGEPVFFRLGAPVRKVVGYGFYAAFHPASVYLAWELFGAKNGAGTLSELGHLLGRTTPASLGAEIGCTLLRDAVFWPEPRWIAWGADRGYADSGIQKGRTDRDPARVALLLGELARDGRSAPDDLGEAFQPVATDARRWREATVVEREGQGTFRMRLLDAYGRQCAVTREHTEPVLDAAHIQPYLGPASNHPQNGLVLTKEFHALFDCGLATVDPPRPGDDVYRLRLSTQIAERWNNGKRYYEHNGRVLHVPERRELRPSREALEWHREEVFDKLPA